MLSDVLAKSENIFNMKKTNPALISNLLLLKLKFLILGTR
jgi:hypothetical protein